MKKFKSALLSVVFFLSAVGFAFAAVPKDKAKACVTPDQVIADAKKAAAKDPNLSDGVKITGDDLKKYLDKIASVADQDLRGKVDAMVTFVHADGEKGKATFTVIQVFFKNNCQVGYTIMPLAIYAHIMSDAPKKDEETF